MVKSKEFENKIGKNIGTLKGIYFFGIALEAFLIFFICAIILHLSYIKFYLAFVPAFLFVVLRFYLIVPKYNKIGKIEEGNPALEEKLRAAYDNVNEDNPIVRELVREVTQDLDGVQTEKFINSKRVGEYIALNVVCVFILLFLLLSGFEIPNFANALGFGDGSSTSGGTGGGQGSGGGGSSSSSEIEEASDTTSMGQGSSEDIFGETSVANIEGEELTLEILPGYGEGEAMDDEDEDVSEKANAVSRASVGATAAGSYTEEIPVEMEEVVRKYFERLAEES